eukprot:5915427-Prymnesium_polylepis.1
MAARAWQRQHPTRCARNQARNQCAAPWGRCKRPTRDVRALGWYARSNTHRSHASRGVHRRRTRRRLARLPSRDWQARAQGAAARVR